MAPYFQPYSGFHYPDRHLVELLAITDVELLDVWEQTQRAIWMLEEKGMDPGVAIHHSALVLWEMQCRLLRQPDGKCFGGPPPDVERPAIHPNIITIRV